MTGNRWTARIAIGALGLLAPVMMGAISPIDSFNQQILITHNLERAQYGVSPLTWDPALASSAQRWADYLAASGKFEHSNDDPRNPQGENLWAGSKGYYGPKAMVDAWIREKRFYKPGVFPNNSTTGDVEDVGHFTQLVWRDTGEVGCARATSQSEDLLVCRYSDAGNYIGERPF
ncbi:MAG: CAP domain-containing protein [Sphingobium sp.]